MTKKELEELVTQIYATYREQIYEVDKKTIFKAWYALLEDLDIEDAMAAFLELATFMEFMPRPGTVRRAAIDRKLGKEEHPDAAAAWSILQEMRKAADTGQFYQGERPAALIETLSQLGGSSADLHTNGDRDTFVRVYNKTVQKLDTEKYQLKRPNNSVVTDGGG